MLPVPHLEIKILFTGVLGRFGLVCLFIIIPQTRTVFYELWCMKVIKMSARARKIVNLAKSQCLSSSSDEFSEDSDDSIADKNYNPSATEPDSTEEDVEDNDVPQTNYGKDDNIHRSFTSLDNEWTENLSENVFDITCPETDNFNDPIQVLQPIEFFQLFVTDELIETMVEEINR